MSAETVRDEMDDLRVRNMRAIYFSVLETLIHESILSRVEREMRNPIMRQMPRYIMPDSREE